MRSAILWVFACLSILPTAVTAATTVLTASRDATISARYPTSYYGTLPYLTIQPREETQYDWRFTGLVGFDLPQLPGDAVVISARLAAHYCASYLHVVDRTIGSCRVTESWDEATVTWNTAPAWTATPTDIVTVPSAYGWLEWDVTTDVQAYADGTWTGEGWNLVDTEYYPSINLPYIRVWSREFSGQEPLLTIVYAVPEPVISSVSDIDGDQGGQVRLVWQASSSDLATADPQATGYAVFRREDGAKRADPADKLAGWDYLMTVPAFADESYQAVVPTLCDSTVSGGMCWSAFLVRAMTTDPDVFHESAPDSGYSVDNLAPAAPGGLAMDPEATLFWADPVDEDFRYFTVYGSDVSEPGVSDVVLGHTTGTSFDVGPHPHFYYRVTATDFAGNEGEGATLDAVTDVPGAVAGELLLHQCRPNPFNPRTVIAFELPEAARVDLFVFNVAGNLVKRLLRGDARGPGRHEVIWNGTDDAGRPVASGSYFYRLVAGDAGATRRMVLVR